MANPHDDMTNFMSFDQFFSGSRRTGQMVITTKEHPHSESDLDMVNDQQKAPLECSGG